MDTKLTTQTLVDGGWRALSMTKKNIHRPAVDLTILAISKRGGKQDRKISAPAPRELCRDSRPNLYRPEASQVYREKRSSAVQPPFILAREKPSQPLVLA